MGEDNKIEKQGILSTEQILNYSVALKKIILLQSRKGYWGRGELQDRVTYTSQGIQLMQALGVPRDEKNFKKAVRWLEDNINNVQSHWVTCVELGLKLGDSHRLATNDNINLFLRDLEYDLDHSQEEARLDFFWDIIPTLIALYPYEHTYKKSIPHERVVKKIIDNSENFGDTITIQFQANHTGLAALYLTTIIDKGWEPEYKNQLSDYRDKMVKWLLANREENASCISWQMGVRITSYVLIDLLGCGLEEKIRKYIPKIVRFIAPNSKGNVKRDEITTYDTELHTESLYGSMLVLRAMTEVLKMEDTNKINDIRNKVFKYSWFESLFARISRAFYYNKKKMKIIICIIISIVGCILYMCGKEFSSGLLITIGVSCLITYLFEFLEKD